MTDSKGLAEENAQKLCAYIGRQAGKIKSESGAAGVSKRLRG